jgi:hypothetical protein
LNLGSRKNSDNQCGFSQILKPEIY